MKEQYKAKILYIITGLFIGWFLSFVYILPLFKLAVPAIESDYLYTIVILMMAVIMLFVFSKIKQKFMVFSFSISTIICLLLTLIISIDFFIEEKSLFANISGLVIASIFALCVILFIISLTYFQKRFMNNKKYPYSLIAYTMVISYVVLFCCIVTYNFSGIEFSIILNLIILLIAALLSVTMLKNNKTFTVDSSICSNSKCKVNLPLYYLFLALTSIIDGGIVAIVQNQAHIDTINILLSISAFIIAPVLYLMCKKISNNYRVTALVSILISTIGLVLYDVNQYFMLICFAGIAMSKILCWGLGLKINSVHHKTYVLSLLTLSVYSIAVFARYLLTKKVYLIDHNAPAFIVVFTISMVAALAILPYYIKNVVNEIDNIEQEFEYNPIFAKKLGQLCSEFDLTKRECEVIKLIVQDFKYQQAADELFISINTVRSHIKSIYNKIGVKNKTALIAKVNHQQSRS